MTTFQQFFETDNTGYETPEEAYSVDEKVADIDREIVYRRKQIKQLEVEHHPLPVGHPIRDQIQMLRMEIEELFNERRRLHMSSSSKLEIPIARKDASRFATTMQKLWRGGFTSGQPLPWKVFTTHRPDIINVHFDTFKPEKRERGVTVQDLIDFAYDHFAVDRETMPKTMTMGFRSNVLQDLRAALKKNIPLGGVWEIKENPLRLIINVRARHAQQAFNIASNLNGQPVFDEQGEKHDHIDTESGSTH